MTVYKFIVLFENFQYWIWKVLSSSNFHKLGPKWLYSIVTLFHMWLHVIFLPFYNILSHNHIKILDIWVNTVKQNYFEWIAHLNIFYHIKIKIFWWLIRHISKLGSLLFNGMWSPSLSFLNWWIITHILLYRS